MKSVETKRFWLLVAGATLAIMLGCWLSSGTMPPYGSGEYGPCHYRANGDQGHFDAVYRMLAGRPKQEWIYSVVLRRILHPLLAFPFMKLFKFTAGGIIFNIISHGIAMIALALAIRRYFDARAAVLVCWLFASYPGYAYWAGLPYSYAFIVPGSIACTIGLLWWNDRPSTVRTVIAACIVGIVGLGYDLIPYFGGALLLAILMKRRWRDLPVALGVLGAWALFIARGIPAIFDFPALNNNTDAYGTILGTWLHFWQHIHGWGAVLLDAPHVFISNFFFSGSIVFPILFLLVIAHNIRYRVRPIVGTIPLAILLAVFAVLLFLNLCPPYQDYWQLRGTWLARLYQPWFVVVLLVVAAASVALRETGRATPGRALPGPATPGRYKLLVGAVIATSIAGWLAIAGPYVRIYAVYLVVQQNFYQDASLHKNWGFLHRLGVRPYGICRR